MMLRLLLIGAFWFTNQSAFAQDRCFTYDAAGNRTARISCILLVLGEYQWMPYSFFADNNYLVDIGQNGGWQRLFNLNASYR
jgi:hypothetical protein